MTQLEVPAGYVLDRDNSLFVSRSMAARSSDASARRLRRLGFVSGYSARYTNTAPPRWRYVDSGAYVFDGRK